MVALHFGYRHLYLSLPCHWGSALLWYVPFWNWKQGEKEMNSVHFHFSANNFSIEVLIEKRIYLVYPDLLFLDFINFNAYWTWFWWNDLKLVSCSMHKGSSNLKVYWGQADSRAREKSDQKGGPEILWDECNKVRCHCPKQVVVSPRLCHL